MQQRRAAGICLRPCVVLANCGTQAPLQFGITQQAAAEIETRPYIKTTMAALTTDKV